VARKVLIADDSPTVQKKAGGILTGEGYEVVTVSNGVAAVKKLRAVMPLVVLVDVAMPGKDGYEVCEFVKKDDALKHVPVLLVFSDMDPVEEDKAARVQADGRIEKPFKPEDLVSVVGKFAAMAEAAAAEAVALPPPPAPVYVTEAVDAEPEPERKQAMPDMSSFSDGMAIGDMGAEEHFARAPSPVEPAAESRPEMPPPDFAAAELPPTPPQSPPVSAEPLLVEEAAPTPPPQSAEEEPPAAERTMLFHAPSEIAEPMLSEEPTGAPAPPEPAAPPSEPEISAAAATTLESFSLQDAESGQVRFAAGEEAPVAGESVAPPPAAPNTLDAAQVFAIVHRVVVRMSPPALSPQIVEDIARRFTDELMQELNPSPDT
jgi:CheY-like chemotaxis protein